MSENIDWFSIAVAVATVVGVGYSIFRGINAEKSERKAREAAEKRDRESREEDRKISFAELLEKFDHDIQDILNRIPTLEKYEECVRFAGDYLNVMERLAYLKQKGKIDETMIKHYDWFFSFSIKVRDWLKEIYEYEPDNPKLHWPKLNDWIEEQGIVKDGSGRLPDVMKKYLDEKKKRK